jgi:glycosyltransferase involved in cell wall biosynthesis
MKILYIHQHFSTPDGAVGIRSYQMARRLIERGHQVTMVCGSYGGGKTGLTGPMESGRRRGVIDDIEVIEFDLSYSNDRSFVKRALLFMRFMLSSIFVVLTEPYDLVFATTTPLTVGFPGLLARWIRRKPFVFEVRDLWPELPKAMGVISNPAILLLLSALEWMSYHSAHRLVGLSPGIVDGIVHRGISRDRIALVPNGCDLGIFSEGNVVWRPEGVRESDFLALFAGTHGLANGLDAAIDAGAELARRGRDDIKILLIGQGMEKPRLRQRVEKEALGNVVFHDPVNKAQLAKLLNTADIGLQLLANVPAFYYGTSPNKFFDYIASGLPVLNNYPGWLANLIKEHQCGFAIPPDSPQAFADALEHAANDRQRLKQMGANASALARAQFDRHVLADKWVDWVTGTPDQIHRRD